ncbi:hypothetical protein [Paracoccus sp. R86501]|uniref:hypothetical protein n=1 Tax=Paracoccus sp. R86501 TaxID=3101711 RepID=UPI00366E8ABC
MPKTGSTAIQDAFHEYRDGALSYAPFVQKNHCLPLASIFSQTPQKLREFAWKETPIKEIEREIARARAVLDGICSNRRSVILSGEALLDQLTPDEFASMVGHLRSNFDRVVALIYVRPLRAMAPSQVQQRIKMGQSDLTIPPPHYKRRIGPVIDLLGPEDVKLIRFHRDDLVAGDIVTDFAHRIGAKQVPATKDPANETMSSEALGAIMSFNRYVAPLLRVKERTRLRRELERALRGKGTTKFGLTEDVLNEHLDRHRAELDWAEELCGFSLRDGSKEVAQPVSSAEELMKLAYSAGLRDH